MKKAKYTLTALVLTIIMVFNISVFASDKLLKVHFIDVGQADSILIQAPNGKNMLIDAGETKDNAVLSYLNNLGIKRLDTVIATHPHNDHISEIDDVIKKFEIGTFYMPNVSHTTQAFENMAKALKIKGIKANEAKKGITISLDSDLSCDIIAPNSNKYESLNNWSTVIHLTYGDTSFLFTGDAEELSEKEILESGVNIKSNVLKIGHHGSSTSTSANFLKAVNPTYAVISYEKVNDYGHPHKETVEKLKNITTYNTAKDGNIIITSDSKKLSIETSNSNLANKDITSRASTEKNTIQPTTQNAIKELTVYITKTGAKYHNSGCQYLKRSKIAISLKDAKLSYTPCSKCNPPK